MIDMVVSGRASSMVELVRTPRVGARQLGGNENRPHCTSAVTGTTSAAAALWF